MRSGLSRLSDEELLAKITALAADERQAMALLIAHLAELDARRLYLAEGYSSLFTYCTEALHLSEHAAYGRIEAARASRKFPILLDLLADGSLTLTTVGLLAPHMTAENCHDLLEKARYKSKRAVEELVAELAPRPAVTTIVRRLPAPRSGAGSLSPDHEPQWPDARGQEVAGPPTPAASQSHGRPVTVTPLAPRRYRVQFTASAETCGKLRQAQSLLRHQIPDGDLDQIIHMALTMLVQSIGRQKVAATERPRGARPTRGETRSSRHIPADVKRAVWLRDGGRCTFVGAKGRRCDEAGFVEFHHVRPYAEGGQATVDNIQLRCRAHNLYEAELHFGPRVAAGVAKSCGANSVRAEFGAGLNTVRIA